MKTSLTIIAVIVIALNSSIQASIIYVDGSKTGGNGNSWATAYGDLQIAIDNASAGDEIWVKNGVYNPHATDRMISFTLKDGVAIYGGFSGTETIRQQRNENNTATILSGDIGTNNDRSDNSYTVVYGVGLSNSTILDGFIITEGNADGLLTISKNGGGLFLDSANPILENIQFLNNRAIGLGGAIYNAGINTATIQFCAFTDNQADTEGGAIYNAGLNGGNSSPTIVHCTFLNNASHFGGAIYNNGNDGISNPRIISCGFTGNNATGGGSIAGAIYNFAKDGGNASPEVTNCTFYGNSSVSSAGAFYSLGDNGTSTPSLNNCTFFLNNAGTGGAAYVNESNNGQAEIIINNSIFWNNSAGYNPTFQMSSSGTNQTPTITLNHVLIDAIDCNDIMQLGSGDILHCYGTNIYNQNPKFANGFAGDFELQNTSPAIEAGINSGIPSGVITDKAGNARITFNVVDIGAFENVSALPVEWSTFDAYFDSEQVLISWTTLSESNNDYFTVERSLDGVNFKAIDRQNGAAYSNAPLRYRSSDPHPAVGLNYYRLQQTDYDGTSTYSEVKVVKIESGKIELYPNPVVDRLYIATSDYENGMAQFSIHNLTGKEVFRGATEVNSGLSVIRLDEMTSLIPGTYVVRLHHEKNGSFSKKFMKVGL